MITAIKKLFQKDQKWKTISPSEFEKMRMSKEYLCLDVRTPSEFKEFNLKGSKNMNLLSTTFKQEIKSLDTSKSLLVVCRSGSRSKMACKQLVRLGFDDVFNVEGGFLKYNKGIEK